MSRPRMTPELAAEMARQNFQKAVKIQRFELNLTQKELGAMLGIEGPHTGKQLANPDKIPVGRLRKIIQILHLDPLIVLALLGYTEKDIKQLREQLAA